MKGIADTGFFVAFLNRRDQHHNWAVSLAKTISEPLLTCEAVLAETAFHVESSELTLALVEEGMCKLSFKVEAHQSELQQLAKKYRDRNPDLADLCLIRMSELYKKLPVITTDKNDFSIYRKNGREQIPLILPSAV